MSVSIDTNSLAQQIKDVTLNTVSAVKEAVVGEAAPVDDKHRVFVGNLSFETTEDQLKSLFSQAGEVVSVTLPTRRNVRAKGAQPSGIAFIGYTNDGSVEKAVETLNGKSLDERELNVAVARPLAQKKPRKDADQSASNQGNGADAATSTNNVESAATSGTEKKKRTRKPKNASATTSDDKATELSAETNSTQTEKTRSSPREKGPPSDGIPSTTTLFVAGLSHKTTDAELKELFSKYSPTSAHVALRPIPRFMIKKLAEKGEQRLGRGFGFVTFADQAAQTSALKAMDGLKIGDRELAVKVAVDSPEKTQAATSTSVGTDA